MSCTYKPAWTWPRIALGYNRRMVRPRFNALVGALVLVLAVGSAVAASPVDGKWQVTWDTEGGVRHQEWTIRSTDSGVVVGTNDMEFQGTFEDGKLKFSGSYYAARAGYSSKLTVEAELNDDGKLTGSGTWGQYAMTFVGTQAE